ncbi:unnamed protein product [Cyprideis torosa]|uniref:Uncharacterized protein n=1 Tax=Cyprideis torosa TaxID=163714 RepID=A0A7R8WL21_9CRUS|nr:unnamed protein product [Cyprideis torosa]CAG0897571.1 unnamed protein product [Cyprideis torosa]
MRKPSEKKNGALHAPRMLRGLGRDGPDVSEELWSRAQLVGETAASESVDQARSEDVFQPSEVVGLPTFINRLALKSHRGNSQCGTRGGSCEIDPSTAKYDLAFKACGCRCNRGHLKKDLDWRPPLNPHREAHNGHNNRPQDGPNGNGVLQANNHHQKKKRRNRNNNVGQQIPMLGLRLVQGSHHGDCTAQAQNQGPGSLRDRAGSMSSTGSSPCSSESPSSPVNGMSSSASSASSTGEGLTGGRGARRKTVGFDFQHCERIRHGSDGNGIFSRRPDFSSFNVLPKRKINSYHIKFVQAATSWLDRCSRQGGWGVVSGRSPDPGDGPCTEDEGEGPSSD